MQQIQLELYHIKRKQQKTVSFLSKALTVHQLKLISTNKELHFYHSFKTDTKKSGLLDAINNPQHRTAISKFRLGNHQLRIDNDLPETAHAPQSIRRRSSRDDFR